MSSILRFYRIKVKVTVGVQSFPIYHNPNWQVLLVQASLGTSWEPYIKYVCSSDTDIQNL